MSLDEPELARYARMICEYAETKGNCGLVLSKFGAGLQEAQALGLVASVLSKEFFRDLMGKMGDFLEQLGALRPLAETLLDAEYRVDEGGELLESDQDSNGNLRYAGPTCAPHTHTHTHTYTHIDTRRYTH
jgi:hypothetical protein